MIAVTTFSQTGYDLYGKRFLESAAKYWPTKIIVYTEGSRSMIAERHAKFEYRNLFDIPGCATFLQYIQNVPLAHGKTPEGYNYNFDCWKFCRKVFAQIAVCQENHGKVFWLDADLEFTKRVPEEFLDGLVSDYPLAYLGREGLYTETGFIGFNMEHADGQRFISHYETCYRRGIIFQLDRWHDCEAFDWARQGIIGNNLSSFYVHGETAIDVLPRSVLGEYMKHHKGKRKYK